MSYERPIKFGLGSLSVSHRALLALLEARESLTHLLGRHREGDYGMHMEYEERKANEESIARRGRVRSFYKLPGDDWLEVVTIQGWDETKVFLRGEDW